MPPLYGRIRCYIKTNCFGVQSSIHRKQLLACGKLNFLWLRRALNMKLIILCLSVTVVMAIDGLPVESEGSGDDTENQTVAIAEEQDKEIATAKPTHPDNFKPDSEAEITHYHNNIDLADGTYTYGFATSNGIEIEETGGRKELIDKESGDQVFGTQSSGKYSFVHGKVKVTVTWKADENGYQPKVEFTTL